MSIKTTLVIVALVGTTLSGCVNHCDSSANPAQCAADNAAKWEKQNQHSGGNEGVTGAPSASDDGGVSAAAASQAEAVGQAAAEAAVGNSAAATEAVGRGGQVTGGLSGGSVNASSGVGTAAATGGSSNTSDSNAAAANVNVQGVVDNTPQVEKAAEGEGSTHNGNVAISNPFDGAN